MKILLVIVSLFLSFPTYAQPHPGITPKDPIGWKLKIYAKSQLFNQPIKYFIRTYGLINMNEIDCHKSYKDLTKIWNGIEGFKLFSAHYKCTKLTSYELKILNMMEQGEFVLVPLQKEV